MKILSSLILSLCSVLGYSQTILYQQESTSRTVQDPQTVVLAQGFKATASTSNPFIAKIGPATENPGGGPTDSQAGVNNPSGTIDSSTLKYDDTKGNIEVTNGGQLQFTLPIAMPPGVKNVSPNLSLVYLSNSGNGIAGYGWTLSGLTAISRIGKNIDKDGISSGVQLDYSDYYSFNGQRLILKSGEYGKDGAEYITEKYSNVKIKSIGNIANWKQPQSWEVTFEDGSQAWYGGTNDSTNRMEFNIVKWKDAQGNYITYNYSQSENVAVVTSITWGGNQDLNTPSLNEIVFNYIDRDFVEGAYINGPGTMYVQTKLLKDILVKSKGNQFKKYVFDYFKNGTNYQFINKITEYNANNQPANPIKFEYPVPTAPAIANADYSNADYNNIKFTADLNGDSYVDFIFNNGNIRLSAFNDSFVTVTPNKTFNSTALIVNTLLDEEGQVHNGNGIVQYEDGKITGYIFKNNVFVKVFEKQVYDLSNCTNTGDEKCTLQANLSEGDVNGDGISDIFLTLNARRCVTITNPNCIDPSVNSTSTSKDALIGPIKCIETICNTDFVGNYIVDLKNSNNPISSYTLEAGINESSYTNQKYIDIDGDGKIDIINVSNNAYTVFEFIKTAPNQYLKKIKFTDNLVETKDNEFPILYGDYNGDGKIDFAIPTGIKSTGLEDWRFYIGTGKSFNNYFKQNFLGYKKRNSSSDGRYLKEYFLSVGDLNKDGKSDIIQVFSYSDVNMQSNGWRNFGFTMTSKMSNGNMIDGSPSFASSLEYNSTQGWVQNIYNTSLYIPVTVPVKSNNNYYDVFIFREDVLMKIRPQTPISELARIRVITQDANVITYVKYLEAVPDINPNFYRKTKKEFYPYFSLDRVDQTFVVSQLEKIGRTQDFRYRGMTGHLQGKGISGYNQIARSTWYTDGYENTKVWSGTETDPQNEGLPIKEWSIRTNDETKIFPTDISENNSQLLSFKSTSYKIDKLLNGQLVTTVVDADKPKIVTAILPNVTKSKNFLTNTFITENTSYGDYYLPSSSVTNINNGFAIASSDMTYSHNPNGIGKDYYIGRPASKTLSNSVSSYNSTIANKEEYTYDSNLLKTLKKWNRDNTGYVTETYNYNGFGNITEKTVTNSIDSQFQTTKAQYDPSGRFIIKKTDNLGLETNITYNDWGQVLSEIDPLGNTTTNNYDYWGKVVKSKNNLQGTTTYQYQHINSTQNRKITTYYPDGNQNISYRNQLNENYQNSVKIFNQNKIISTEYTFDFIGRKTRESEPYIEGQSFADKWNSIQYDDTVFPAKTKVTTFNGRQIETTISGNVSTVKELNGYGRTTTKTTDPLGNIISTTDKGGTINFSYNAAKEQVQAVYGENIVKTKYDVWGRKSEYNDPSNGTYKYEYDGFGQIKKMISPKGTKEYSYNNLGQITSQKEISTADAGQSTNKLITFSYDDKGRVISKAGTSKGKAYSSNLLYDPQGRLISSSESSNGKYYIDKGITYDDKSRVISYEKNLYSSGTMTKVNIENVYSDWNGELYQVKDKNSGKILWQLQAVNAKGQILQSKLGEANIVNTYDNNGFLTNVNHSSQAKPGILQLSYSFDAVKNELKSRTTGGDFNIVESFDYDDNNRLVNWTNPVTGVKPQLNRNVYDIKGRIVENDQVGTIKYENSTKVYQATGMTLNPAGTQNYNNDLIQTIVYNENNDPVFIDGEKGDVAFQYGLTSMRQRVTYGGNFGSDGNGKFTKFYSEDGSFEIVLDNTTGKEKHVLYIGGTPYESNFVYLKDYNQSDGSYKFLHKDYLGSILAISDETGNKIEQRHFDAWGNFTHLQIGNGAVITDKNTINNTSLLLERGYTSHEHFAEVGIIHMNGRLYDPLLRRFLNADENIQDPYNTQNYNKYGYVLNNPLMFNDPSGEFLQFLIPILIKVAVGAAYGAIIGAGVAAAAYSIKGLITGNWSWSGFGRAILGGAIAGAISGGLNGLGAALFSTSSFMLNSGTWDLLSNMATMFLQDGKIDLATIGASVIGAFIGTQLPGWNGVSGKGLLGWAKNAAGEILHSSLRYGITGSISGGFSALFRGENVWLGVKGGFENGAINGAAQSSFMIMTFGATYKPSDEQLQYVKEISRGSGVGYENVNWRSGGLYQLAQPYIARLLDKHGKGQPIENYRREVTWGNNVATFGSSGAFTSSATFGHEFGHIFQVQRQGWGNFQAKGIWEQLFMKGNPYEIIGTNETQAESIYQHYRNKMYGY